MSWEEIKKAVNSDISVPLNKKLEYVDGIVPRGIPFTQKIFTGIVNGNALSIQGHGYLLEATANAVYADYNTYRSHIIIYLDENTDRETVIDITATTSGTTSALKIDTNSIFNKFSYCATNTIGDKQTLLSNIVPEFKKSLRVYSDSQPNTYPSVSYILID